MPVDNKFHQLVLASNNAGKLRELRRLLEGLPIEVLTLEQALGRPLIVEETGDSFEANAELKARAASLASGLPALADDSGLEVDALGGRPGVRSARYAGEQATDQQNNTLLLRELEGVEQSARTARFRCVIVLALPDGSVHSVTGSCEGLILPEPRGSGGFGYDPLFWVPGKGGASFAELGPLEKDRVSHRGRALRELQRLLVNQLASQ